MGRESNAEHVLGLPEAMALVRKHAALLQQPAVHSVTLAVAAPRVLAEPVLADRDQPPFNRSTRDGFAVRAEDVLRGALRIVGQVRAGESWTGAALGLGETIEIMTGAPLPAGADAVVMIEHVDEHAGAITLHAGRTLHAGENVVARGSEAAAGAVVIAAGTVLGAAQIALAATCGAAQVQVFARPRVAILATGDELVELEQTPGPQQIRNSNGYALAALAAEMGGEPVRLAISRDDRADLERNLRAAMECELVLLSGGVSMGKYDLVEQALAALGAEFYFTGVRMQPGRPAVFGKLPDGPYFFGLPGNPVSTEVTFRCLAGPLLRALGGASELGPRFALARLAEGEPAKAGLHRLLPARMTDSLEGAEARLVGWKGSGDMAANARANCYAVFPPERESFAAGDVVSVLLR